ncbi:MAG: FkbM family methyltransferase, partial [Pedobacter sp.]
MNYNSRSAFRSLGLIQQIFLVWQLVQVKLFHKRPKSRVFSEFSYLSNLFSDNITLVKTKTKSVLVAYTLNGIAQQIWLRKGSSDFKVFQSVILNHEYKSATKCVNDNPEFFIVDAGANIGTTLLYFKAFYPNATIIAIEPDKNNFRQLKLNIEQNKLENIKVLQ